MADDLDRLMDSIESEGPSPEFVAELRARIVAETTPSTEGDVPVVLIRAKSPRTKRTTARWIPIGMVAAAVVLIVGLVVVSRDDDGLEPLDQPEATTTTVAPEPAAFVTDATPLPQEPSALTERTYRADTVGTPFTFTADEPLWVQLNDQAFVVLTHPGSQRGSDRDIAFTRLSALPDPAAPTVALEDRADGWPANDVGGWLDNVSDEIVVSNRMETTLGGLVATRFDLELGETDCGAGDPCTQLGTNHFVTGKDLYQGSRYRIWFVDQGVEDPIAVVAGISAESDVDWFDTVDRVLATLAFGEVGPNPILDAGPGASELPFLGGIRVELDEESYAIRKPGGFDTIAIDEWPGDTKFLANPIYGDGSPLASADDLAAALGDVTVVTEVESTDAGGFEARVFDIAGGPTEPVLQSADEEGGSWPLPARGRLWLVGHPERGLLMITAEAAENADIVFPVALAQTEAIVASLEFVEPP